jgi:hypothetical protein
MAASSAPSSRLNQQTLKETDLINESLQAEGAKVEQTFLCRAPLPILPVKTQEISF